MRKALKPRKETGGTGTAPVQENFKTYDSFEVVYTDSRGRRKCWGATLEKSKTKGKQIAKRLSLDGVNAVDLPTPGTEDEYGSCWEDPGWRLFSSIYCGHVLNEKGVTRMYRWYVANPVRFQKTLQVEIQNQHNNGTPTTTDADDYTSTAFWYQEEPHQAFGLPGFKERIAPANSSEK
jgi:hypothetical protein